VRPDGGTLQHAYKGILDEVAIFNRALSSNEIASIYAAGSAGICKPSIPCVPPPSDSVGWWTGDGSANDVVGANNGSLQNGATFAPVSLDRRSA